MILNRKRSFWLYVLWLLKVIEDKFLNLSDLVIIIRMIVIVILLNVDDLNVIVRRFLNIFILFNELIY